MNRVFLRLALLLIQAYQLLLSPVMAPKCRFYPTCSEYAYQALSRHGLLKGVSFALKRIIRCHPFNPGGVDPVP
ncbi:MAG: membrane protein insertion efficiency factor YidD [Deltaproteobacteria bacterium]|nr:membrane protein insertion efficiency factor YidD [Deltaproteobacteria bacterium]